jgi:carbonic anhydrase
MDSLDNLFANNAAWSAARIENDPGFFARLAKQQAPRYLWIGCSDSRVPANEIIGLDPGEVFVHRNVANVVAHSDLNCLSVLQFAIDVLKVEHVMVVGHYGCGGVHAVSDKRSVGLADNWLRHVEDVALKHGALLDAQVGPNERGSRLCELNVVEQVGNVCRTTIIRQAWDRGQRVEVHGLVFGLRDGLLRRLGSSVNHVDGWTPFYDIAIAEISDEDKSFIRTSLGA